MLTQKILVGTNPYFLNLSQGGSFELHCHPEIELSYCLKGSYGIVINQKEYILNEGDLAIVNPLSPHELNSKFSDDCLRLTAEIGPSLLGEQFTPLASINPISDIIPLKKSRDITPYNELMALLEETAELLMSKPSFYNLSIKGNIYKISALLLKTLTENSKETTAMFKSLTDIEKISRAVDMIYNRYEEQITLDSVSKVCGYSKSNFCKTFKAITGKSFHAMLNHHRIDVACLRLKEHNDYIENIALSVGFADSKSFCRVFKKNMGMSAIEYKKSLKLDGGSGNESARIFEKSVNDSM